MLLLVGMGLPLIAFWSRDWLFPELSTIAIAGRNGETGTELALQSEISWRAIAQPALVLIGIPTAFILWIFRDINASKDLESKRKDVNLKEFQEIQMRAAGAMDEKLPTSARESLQIAATHQLAGFLKGEYGASFQRPAWELLRARLLASSQRMGYPAIPAWLDRWRQSDPLQRMPTDQLGQEIGRAIMAIRMDSTGKAQRDVVRDEWRTVFGPRLPLQDTVFDGINAPAHSLLASRDLTRCSFIGADLEDAHLEGADLEGAHLEGAELRFAHLEGAMLVEAHLEGANLVGAHLEGANLLAAHLEGAYLEDAHLEGAHLEDAQLEGANLRYAHLEGTDLQFAHLEGAILWDAHLDDRTVLQDSKCDNATQFAEDWDKLSDAQKDKARLPWLKHGMINIDDQDGKTEEPVPPPS